MNASQFNFSVLFRLVGLMSLLLGSVMLHGAHVSVQPVILQGANVNVDTISNDIYDPESYNSSGTFLNPGYFDDLQVRNTIAAKLDLDNTNFHGEWVRYDILIYVQYFNELAETFQTGVDTLTLTFDPDSRTQFQDKSFLSFEGGLFVKVWILDIIEYDDQGATTHVTEADEWVELEMRIDMERYYGFSRLLTPTVSTITETDGMITVNWTYSHDTTSQAESFDLEWTFVDSYSKDVSKELAYDFEEYSIRVNVPLENGMSYTLENVFPEGWLVFRVRAIGRISTDPRQRQEGVWTLSNTGSVASPSSPPYYTLSSGHESDKNWRYIATYIEEGKHKGVITYHDGTLRTRQTVTRLSEEATTLVGETIYDFEGRPTLQILPTPVYNAADSAYYGHFQYFEEVNVNSLGDPYSWEDFDTDGPGMAASLSPLATTSGAGRYYSTNNPSQTGAHAFIADAGGYPFVRTEYMPDNTGRVRMQGGVGADHQAVSDIAKDSIHATRYYYSVPMQEILDGLFGTEVGYAKYYRRTTAIDPNGQVTETITDPEGRTIATYLGGEAPENLVELENYAEPILVDFDLTAFNDTANGNSLVSSFSHTVIKDTTIHTFSYSLEPGKLQDSCSGVSFCYECVYDFEFIIQDLSGDTIAYHSEILGPYNQIDSLCNDSTPYVPTGFTAFVDTLDEGQYQITKRLSVNQASLAAYAELYLEDYACLKTEEDFFQDLVAEIDFSLCDDDPCDLGCKAELGFSLAEYRTNIGDPSATLQQYQAALDSCWEDCTKYQTPCDAWRYAMEFDMSPGGRFAQYLLDSAQTGYIGDATTFSILDLSQDSSFQSPLLGAFSPDSIEVAGQNKAVTDLSVTEFVIYFQESWAETLIEFHPDYCAYNELCGPSGTMLASYRYDASLQNTMTAQQAADSGFIDLGDSLINFNSNLLTPGSTNMGSDPYFQSGAGESFVTFFQDSILDTYTPMAPSGYSMMSLVVSAVYCKGLTSQSSLDSCIAENTHPFADPCYADEAWLYLRGFYLGEKGKISQDSILAGSSCPIPTFPITYDSLFAQLGFKYQELISDTITSTPPSVLDSLNDGCEDQCEAYRDYWNSKLTYCGVGSLTRDSILNDLQAICECGCKEYLQPLGSLSVPPQNVCGLSEVTLEEVLNTYGITTDPFNVSFDPLCEALEINMPPLYGHSLTGVAPGSEGIGGTAPLDTCACNKILAVRLAFETGPYPTVKIPNVEALLEQEYGIELADIDPMICGCDQAFALDYPGLNWAPGVPWGSNSAEFLASEGLLVSGYLACPACLPCEELSPALDSLYSTGLPGQPNGPSIITSILNKRFNLNLEWSDYDDFYEACNAYVADTCEVDDQVTDLVQLLQALIEDSSLTGSGISLSSLGGFVGSSLYPDDSTCQPVFSGQAIFRRKLDLAPNNFLIRESDGGIYLVGAATDQDSIIPTTDHTLSVTSLLSDFSVDWEKQLHLPGYDFLDDVKMLELSSGNLLIAAPVQNDTSEQVSIYFAEFTPTGSFLGSGTSYDPIQVDTLLGLPGLFQRIVGLSKRDNDDLLLTTEENIYPSLGTNGGGSHIYKVRTNGNNSGLQELVYVLFDANDYPSDGHIGLNDGQHVSTSEYREAPYFETSWFNSSLAYSFSRRYDLAQGGDLQEVHLAAKPDTGLVMLSSTDTIANSFQLTNLGPIGQVRWSNNYSIPGIQLEGMDVEVGSSGEIWVYGQVAGLSGYVMVMVELSTGLVKKSYRQTSSADFGGKIVEIEQEELLLLEGLRGPNVSGTGLTSLQRIIWDKPDPQLTCGFTDLDIISSPLVLESDSLNHQVTFNVKEIVLSPIAYDQEGAISPSCTEQFLIKLSDTCGYDCEITLNLPTTLPGASFALLDSVYDPQGHADGSFSFQADYTYDSVQYSVLITGTSTCFDTCEAAPMLCNEPMMPQLPKKDSCEEFLLSQARIDAQTLYKQYRDSVLDEFTRVYTEACLQGAAAGETYTMGSEHHGYHYMLYVYDQAGNLTKTINPQATKMASPDFSNAFTDSVQTARLSTNPVTIGYNFHVSRYRYNSLNQVIYYKTIEANETRYWYDELGRQLLAQDAKQVLDSLYSFTQYDALGRPYEAGEVDGNGAGFPSPVAINDATNYIPYNDYETWLGNGDILEYTYTTYDVAGNGNEQNEFPAQNQTNLRNRVSYVSYYNPDPELDYEYHTFYSYDIQGNVHTLIHDYPDLEIFDARYKRIDYEYDYLSGNVNQVTYQPGQIDRFIHRYVYDSDNRIQYVETSPDSVFFDRDASYEYLLHGPLARTELGEWDVQGVDYAYTIHGWIKGVNAETLLPDRDFGQDGVSSTSHESVARDAYGYALHYYRGDYEAISSPPASNHFLSNDDAFYTYSSGTYTQPLQLYNGNIMMMQTALMDQDNGRVAEQRMKYEHDQLHRIRRWKSLRDTTLHGNNSWTITASQTNFDYSGDIKYDPIGKIKYFDRWGHISGGSGHVDRLAYAYYNSGNNRERLQRVNDVYGGSSTPDEFVAQPNNNYTYYDNGQLRSDSADFIHRIYWNVAGKIDRIVFNPDSTKPEQLIFRYDAMGQRVLKLVQPDTTDSTTWAWTYYMRDAQGNVLSTYQRGHFDPAGTAPPAGIDTSLYNHWDSLGVMSYLKADEYHLYGSSRIGVYAPELYVAFYTDEDSLVQPLYGYNPYAYHGDPCGCDTTSTCSNPPCDPCWCYDNDPCGCPACETCDDCYCSDWPVEDYPDVLYFTPQSGAFVRGRKRYELTNHLGNVLSVVSDRKLQISEDSTTVEGWNPDIWAWHDYNPFGTTQQNRSWQATNYRYGFQGQEADDELFGPDDAIAFTFRMYDARIGRFLSIDPLAQQYPWNSPYAFSENRVIDGVELEGLERVSRTSPATVYKPKMVVKRGGQYGRKVGAGTSPFGPAEPEKIDPYRHQTSPAIMHYPMGGPTTVGVSDNYDKFWLTLARLLDPGSGSIVVPEQTQARLDQNVAYVEALRSSSPAVNNSFRDLVRVAEAYERIGEGTATGQDFNIVNDERAGALAAKYENGGEFVIIEQHHIIPNQLKSHSVVQAAIRAGYEFDRAENLMPLLAYRREKQPDGVHAWHPRYNDYVRLKLNEFAEQSFTDGEALEFLRSQSLFLRAQIESKPQAKVNIIGQDLLDN